MNEGLSTLIVERVAECLSGEMRNAWGRACCATEPTAGELLRLVVAKDLDPLLLCSSVEDVLRGMDEFPDFNAHSVSDYDEL